MNIIYRHPNAVSGVSVDKHMIATSCFDGFVRLFNELGSLIMAEQRASQLNAVAVRDGVILADDDTSMLETGVAITIAGLFIREADFGGPRILAIDKSGQFGVSPDQHCYDRLTGDSWRVVPETAGHDKWPISCEITHDLGLAIVSQDGYLRVWHNRMQTYERQLAANGLNSVDVSADGTRLVVTHWGKTAGSNPQPGIMVLDGGYNTLYEAVEDGNVIHQARFLADNTIVYGTHDGRLCHWDGQSPIYTPPTPAPVSPTPKPVKGKGKGK